MTRKNDWAEVVKRFPEANFLQSPAYGHMNEILGSKVITEDFGGRAWALMIVRDAKRGRYLEIPCGPLLNFDDAKLIGEVFARIREVAKEERCVFVRIRPQLYASEENLKLLAGLGLTKSPMHLAAEHTVMIDLGLSEEELLAGMRRQTRYEVRRADKFGITVDCDNSEELFREFHKVQVETAKRQDFVPPSLKTLLAEREAFGDKIWIYVARVGDNKDVREKFSECKPGEPIAYGLIIGNEVEVDYYEAASTELNRKLPGAYALLWQVMRDMKKAGYKRFNLWGIAPAGHPEHRYAGVTTFKTGFGGSIVEFVPAHDIVISRTRYMADYAFETLRKKRRHL